MQSWSRPTLAAVLVLGALLLLLGTRAVPLIDPDEPRFARTSVEMLRRGDPVVPYFEGEPRLVKPPLLHWAQAGLFGPWGAGELTARLPSVLATLGSAMLLAWVARRRFGGEAPAWAAAFFLTSPLVVALGRLGTTDALLAVHVMGVLALDLTGEDAPGRLRAAGIGALLGLAFLAKGPVGVLVPLLVLLAGRTATGRPVAPSAGAVAGFLTAWCAVVLPWGIAFLRRVGVGTTVGLLRGETMERFFAGTDHVKPVWYYVPVLLLGFVPWIAPVAVGGVRAFVRRRDPAASTALYAAAGLAAGVVFFSLGRGKLPNYLLPLAPLAALLATWELGQSLEQPRSRTLTPALLSGTLAAFGLTLMFAATRYPAFAGPALAGAAIQLTAGAAAIVAALLRRPRYVYGIAAAASFGFMLLMVTQLLPAMMQARSARELIREVPALRSRRPVVVVEMQVPSLTFYLDRVPERITAGDLPARLERRDRALYVVDPDDLKLIDEAASRRWVEVGRQGKYRVYERSAQSAEDESRTRVVPPNP